ncbi:MAG: tyrosine-protein phosphatase [Acidimicrobiales bacterium]|nr:tyrosine-protein phosphatase [Acidimicrobiales bacterium]
MSGSDQRARFETCFNFRDLGGHEGLGGRRVRRGVVYRSDSLHRVTGPDLELVRTFGVRTVLDLRTTGELTRWGRFPLADELAWQHLPLFEEEAIPFELARPDDPEPPAIIARGWGYVAIAAAGTAPVSATLRAIAEGEHAVVFHCSAGKDRTGIVAALLLSVLGVRDEAIVADYERSDGSVEAWLRWAKDRAPEEADRFVASTPSWVMRAPAPLMQGFLEGMRQTYGSIEGYLAGIGVDEAMVGTLRERLLEQ